MQRLCRVLKENAPLFFLHFFSLSLVWNCVTTHTSITGIYHILFLLRIGAVVSVTLSILCRSLLKFWQYFLFFFLSTFKISRRLLVFDPSYLSISFAAKQEKKQSNAPLVLGTLQANSFDRRRTFCNCPSGSTLSQSNSASANQRAELEVSNKCQF